MNQVDRIHSGDIVISVIVIATQGWIAWMLWTRWRKRLPLSLFALTLAALSVIWAVSASSLVMNFFPGMYFAPVFRGIASGTEIVWGFLSACAIAIYFLYTVGAEHVPGRRDVLKKAALAVAVAPAAALAYGGLIERTRFVVREVDLPIANLHPDLEGFRIAQISDLHAGPYLSVRQVARVVDMTNELKPHLSLVTGDLISEIGDPLDATIDELARLRADTGVLGCLGNHEVYTASEDYVTQRAGARGIAFLRGQAVPLRRGSGVLNVAGVDFQSYRHKDKYLAGASGLMLPGAANLLLSHNPDVFPVAARLGFDAVIGGHTHGGQVALEILHRGLNFARFFTPYVAGLYRLQDKSCYVTSGIGTIGMPVRLGAPPEITLLRLRRA